MSKRPQDQYTRYDVSETERKEKKKKIHQVLTILDE